jgi:hypothetical protein
MPYRYNRTEAEAFDDDGPGGHYHDRLGTYDYCDDPQCPRTGYQGDEHRDYAEEAYWRDYCQACGDSPCGWDGVTSDGFHTDDPAPGDNDRCQRAASCTQPAGHRDGCTPPAEY